jgi:peptidoglycan-N-acetylglucosamine deacetylase
MVVWIIVALLAFLALAGALLGHAATNPGSQWFGPAVVRLTAESKKVALTFDDGPSVPYTGQILALLRERQVKATFFVCGQNVERHSDIARRIVAEGHAIGNHTYSHPFLYLLRRKAMAEEIDRAQLAIEKATGVRPKLFRPPYGIRWFGLSSLLRERGLRMIMWSGTGFDWKYGRDQIFASTVSALEQGAVIVLHDGHGVRSGDEVNRSNTCAALPGILDVAKSRGIEFGLVQEALPNDLKVS